MDFCVRRWFTLSRSTGKHRLSQQYPKKLGCHRLFHSPLKLDEAVERLLLGLQ